MNSDKIILDLCGGTGSWSKPYAEHGYDVRNITLPDNDVTTYRPPENVYGIFAAPPCTEFSLARITQRNLQFGKEIVDACLGIIMVCYPVFWALENPEGNLKKFLGEPRYKFQPWEFGDPWTKKTLLWGKFNFPKKRYSEWETVPKIKELYIRPSREKPSIAFLHKSAKEFIPSFRGFTTETDADFRSITPTGFAKAFFEANQ